MWLKLASMSMAIGKGESFYLPPGILIAMWFCMLVAQINELAQVVLEKSNQGGYY